MGPKQREIDRLAKELAAAKEEIERLKHLLSCVEVVINHEVPNQVSSYRQGQMNMQNRVRKAMLRG